MTERPRFDHDDEIATEAIAKVHGNTFEVARNFFAMKLKEARRDGELLEYARNLGRSNAGAKPVLRELTDTQADHDDAREAREPWVR